MFCWVVVFTQVHLHQIVTVAHRVHFIQASQQCTQTDKKLLFMIKISTNTLKKRTRINIKWPWMFAKRRKTNANINWQTIPCAHSVPFSLCLYKERQAALMITSFYRCTLRYLVLYFIYFNKFSGFFYCIWEN